MSNCIEIYGESAIWEIPWAAIDRSRWENLKQRHATHTGSPNIGDSFCWFIKDNTTETPNALRVEVGRGRSSHTWRDFKHTMALLSCIITEGQGVSHSFKAADEFDGFDTRFYIHVMLARERSTVDSETWEAQFLPQPTPIAYDDPTILVDVMVKG